MTLQSSDIKKIIAALDIQRYRQKQKIKFPDSPYSKLADKFFSNKPVTLPEMNQICSSEASTWSFVQTILQLLPVHGGLCLDGEWNGETMTNGMVLAHTITRATSFLPIELFVYVFATLARQKEEGGISFSQATDSVISEVYIAMNWQEIFMEWIGDLISSRDRALDLAMHTAGSRLYSLSLLMTDGEPESDKDQEKMRISQVRDLLLGVQSLPGTPARKRKILGSKQEVALS